MRSGPNELCLFFDPEICHNATSTINGGDASIETGCQTRQGRLQASDGYGFCYTELTAGQGRRVNCD